MEKANIVLLHGALGSKVQFQQLKQDLNAHFNVYEMNFEGHGDRPSDNDFSIELFSNNLHAFLQEMNLNKTHIFGYSMGGYVALHYALNHANFVDRIVTLGTKFKWTQETAAKEVKMLDPVKIEDKIPAFAKYLDTMHTAQSWKAVLQKTAKMMIDLGNGSNLNEEDLQTINHQVLIGIGELDNMVTQEESKHASSLLKNGTLKVIQNFKHPIEQVDMEQLSIIISEFIHNRN